MTGEDVCLAIAADFKMKKISYEEAAKKLGQSVQTVYNRISSKRYFSLKTAQRWAKTFGFDMTFLMTGEGQLYLRRDNSIGSDNSIYSYYSKTEVLIMVADYLFSKTEDKEIKEMWVALLHGDFESFRKLESSVNEKREGFTRLPNQLLQRTDFLKYFEIEV